MFQPATVFEDLPPDLRNAVSAACDRLEAELRGGRPARAEDFLGDAPGVPTETLLFELLVTEIEYHAEAEPGFDAAHLAERLPGRPGLVAAAAATALGTAAGGVRCPIVGPYRLERELGRGAAGAVFLGCHTGTGACAAVKVPHPATWHDGPARARFLGEARAAAALDHPNVARLLESGEDGALCFLAAEYIAGPTLARWLADRGGVPVPDRLAAELLLPVAEALAHAHHRGVLHLDLTPANILLRGGTSPVVTDFGMARVEGEPSGLTATGVLAGTPAFMAPEQAAGRRREADRRADVYALGAVLYLVFTGRPPVVADSLPNALVAAARGYPDRPRRLRPDVPPDLEAVCLRCLERDAARRYPTAAAVADDLRRFLAGEPTQARPPGPLTRLRWWFRRDPAAARIRLVSAGAATILVALVTFHLITVQAANRELATANADLATAKAAAETRAADLRRRGYADAVGRAAALLDLHDVAGARRLLDEYRPSHGEEDLRGFEWHLLDRRAAPTPHRVVAEFPEEVTAVAYAPGGRLAAAGGIGGVVRLFDPATGREAHPRLHHPGPVEYAAFDPAGGRVATACEDGVVRVWAVGADRPPVECRGHEKRAQAVAWSPDGRQLVSGGRDGTVRVWNPDARAGRVLARIGESVRTVAWAPDGRKILACGDPNPNPKEGDYSARLIDPDTGAVLGFLRPDGVVVAAGFLPDGVVTGGRDGTVRVWRPGVGPEWREAARITLDHPRVNDLAVSSDRTTVAVCQDGAASVWRLHPPERLAVLHPPDGGRIWAAAFHPTAGELLTAGEDGRVRAWAAAGTDAVIVTRLLSPSADWLAFHRDGSGTRLAAGGLGGGRVWRLGREPEPQEVLRVNRAMAAGGFDPGGRPVAVARDGGVRAWTDPDPRADPNHVPLQTTGAAIDPGGAWAAVLDGTGVRLQPLGGGRDRAVTPGALVAHLGFGPSGRLAAACFDRTVRVWDSDSLAEVARLNCGSDRPSAVAVGPGGLAAAACEAAVLVWETGDLTPRHRLVGHRGVVSALDFSPDGRTLATGGVDGEVRLWRLDSGYEALALPVPLERLGAIRFSPDGRYLAVGGKSRGTPHPVEVCVYDAGPWLSPPPPR